jgi:hypothetical protein
MLPLSPRSCLYSCSYSKHAVTDLLKPCPTIGLWAHGSACLHHVHFFENWYSGGGGVLLGALRRLIGLLCQPRVIMLMEKLVA